VKITAMESPPQLVFEDTAMGFDYMCSHFRTKPSPAASPVLGDQPRMSISSIVNPSSVTVVSGEFDPASAEMVEPTLTWPSYSGLYDYYSNPNYQTSQEFFGVPCETNVDYSLQGHMADGLPYDYSFPIDCNGEAMSLTCPRSYQPEFGITPAEAVIPSTEAYPPSSYLMDPQKHQSYMAISPRPTERDALVVRQDQEALNQLQICYGAKDALYGRASPAPSSDIDRMEFRISPSDNKDRESEDRDPLSTIGDEMDGGEDDGNQPYAQLIYRALLSAPEHKMVLNEIYDWFRNTYERFNKAKGKGWQNSIRHNLSMNGVRALPNPLKHIIIIIICYCFP
jgi:Forkhead domain